MNTLLRFIAVCVVVPATYFFLYWILLAMMPFDEEGWVATILALLCAGVAGWFFWTRLGNAPEGLVSTMLAGGLLIGGIAFCVGFFGPLIWAPDANQGPLLGIFVTGPLGFVAGLAGGLVYWCVRKKRV